MQEHCKLKKMSKIHKNIFRFDFLLYLLIILTITGCEKIYFGTDPENTPLSNFESLWSTVDKKYTFFSFKGIDWDSVNSVYRPMITDDMTDEELFEVLFEMLSVLKDAHVNLWAPFNISRYEAVFLESPQNFNYPLLQRNYLGNDYKITGALINQIIDSVGYIYYGSFMYYVSDYDIDYVLEAFKNVKGIIIDVRDNGGGDPTNGFKLTSHFTEKKIHVLESYLKNGQGHDDFSDANHISVEPEGDFQFTKKVVVLTNRSSFSATNMFVGIMKALPNVIIMGDTTGGGGGAPAGSELPNGWSYRFSATKTLLPDGFNIENGIPPDILVYMDPADEILGIDSILERALAEFK